MRKLMNLAFALTIAAALALTTTSCTNEDNLTETLSQPQAQKVHITVNAGVGNNATTRSAMVTENGKRVLKFTSGDKLYVRGAISQEDDQYAGPYDNKVIAGMLTVDASSISADGKSASFTGDLTVYQGTIDYTYETYWVDGTGYNDPETGEWIEETPGHNETDYSNILWGSVSYTESSHSFSTSDPLSECIGVSAQLVHAGTESEFNIYEDKSGRYNYHVASSVQELMEQTLEVMSYSYDAGSFELDAYYAILNCTISGLTAGKQYKVELWHDPEDETYDNGFEDYEGSTTANSSGVATFVIPMYSSDQYFKLVLMTPGERKQVLLGWKSLEQKIYNLSRTATNDPNFPTITWTSVDALVNPDYYNDFTINGPGNTAAQITLSGTSVDYRFLFPYGATVTLNNFTASHSLYDCISSSDGDLNLIINGTNRITCPASGVAVNACNTLKLSGNGTLIVTVCDGDYHGLFGDNYNDNSTEVSELAAVGYTVSRSDRVDGPDSDTDGDPDYYSWTYTVKPVLADVNSSDIGKLIGVDGNIYANAAAATAAGTTAVAKIVYVGSDNGEAAPYNHGLALALSDAGSFKWKTSTSDAGHTKQYSDSFTSESGLRYNASHNSNTYPAFKAAIANNGNAVPTACSAWFLASGYQWKKIFTAVGGANKLGLQTGNYWSSTELTTNIAWFFYSGYGDAWNGELKTAEYRVRACLAF